MYMRIYMRTRKLRKYGTYLGYTFRTLCLTQALTQRARSIPAAQTSDFDLIDLSRSAVLRLKNCLFLLKIRKTQHSRCVSPPTLKKSPDVYPRYSRKIFPVTSHHICGWQKHHNVPRYAILHA